MAAFEAEVLNVSVKGLGHPQVVQAQQRSEGVVAVRSDSGLDHEGAELVAVQTQGPGLSIDLGAVQVSGRAALDVALLLAASVERWLTSTAAERP